MTMSQALASRLGLSFALLSPLACAPGSGGDSSNEASSGGDEAGGASNESSSGESSTGESGEASSGGSPQGCSSSEDCEPGYCVAPWDEATASPLGPFVCRLACVEPYDGDVLCADDEACCDAAGCNSLGLCVDPESGTESESSAGP
jgi:hypothetical protein